MRSSRMLGEISVSPCLVTLGCPCSCMVLWSGTCPYICPSCRHCPCQERGSDGISQFAADTALGIRQVSCSGHSQAEWERLVVCRGMVNACTLGLSWHGDRSMLGA